MPRCHAYGMARCYAMEAPCARCRCADAALCAARYARICALPMPMPRAATRFCYCYAASPRRALCRGATALADTRAGASARLLSIITMPNLIRSDISSRCHAGARMQQCDCEDTSMQTIDGSRVVRTHGNIVDRDFCARGAGTRCRYARSVAAQAACARRGSAAALECACARCCLRVLHDAFFMLAAARLRYVDLAPCAQFMLSLMLSLMRCC